MSGNSKIEWTEKVWNPITGCSKVSAGCMNCYAESIAKRFWGERKFTDVQFHPERLEEPFKWKKPARVFVNSMSDLFHKDIPFETISRILDVIRCAKRHTFIVLTKRPVRMLEFFTEFVPKHYITDYNFNLPNLWLGVSVEDQITANARIPYLLQTPAIVRFVSAEPLLGEIDLKKIGLPEAGKLRDALCGYGYFSDWQKSIANNKLDWVIVGAESGVKKRECNTEWIEDIVSACKQSGVPVFVKQIHGWQFKELGKPGKLFVEKDINYFPDFVKYREYPDKSSNEKGVMSNESKNENAERKGK